MAGMPESRTPSGRSPGRALCFAGLLLSAACASHEVRRGQRFDDLPADDATVAVRLVQPKDGSYGGKAAAGSGALVLAAIERFANERYRDVAVGYGTSSAMRTLEITPRLLHWEDRATNWSGISDRIEIELLLRDLPADRRRKLVFAAKSSWFAMVNKPPEALLDEDFDDALAELLPPRADG